MATLQQLIEAVEDNNSVNAASWSDWNDAGDIIECYAIAGIADGNATEQEATALLNRAIETNGESLKQDLPAFELKTWGQNFAGSFWDRS